MENEKEASGEGRSPLAGAGLLAAKHNVTWSWLKGHAGHDGNERCDALANEPIAKIKNTLTPDQLRAERTLDFMRTVY